MKPEPAFATSGRLTLHSQLSSIMETVTRSVLGQVCKLVDEDSRVLRSEVSRLRVTNSTLADRVKSLEGELRAVRRGAGRGKRSVGVQTVCCGDGDAHVPEPPTIAGIFGKDWCMNLWKDGDPSSLDKVVPQSSEESVATLSDHGTVAEMNVNVYVEDCGSGCQQATLKAAVHEENLAEEPEQPSVCYQADNGTFGLSCDQDKGRVLPAGGTGEPSVELMSIADEEAAFNTYIVPIEDDDDDDEVQFIHESQQEPLMNDAGGSGHDEQQTLPSDVFQNDSALNEDSQEAARDPGTEIFTCEVCSREFFHRATLTRHMKSHKTTFCHICKQRFPKKRKLVWHNCVPLIPTDVDRSCELCGKTFQSKSSLRAHYVVHTGEKPHTCSFCGKGFTQKGNLKSHLRLHTGERPFSCLRCDMTFTQKSKLDLHLLSHSYHDEVVAEPPQP